ncbi:hypothetical protein BACCAP_02050 [Pseudoflavonifractor capillosus ATCC 29799]|uniref:Uncharacterized protein n=1 Tax=Pseudoflavonifractor capillosus ATCC 29799 TaxID=411467 RepID=A6NV16_9FIRM|nr:hypothetical protein BACCAP_02050 [Pseudoflavonifractor capillosus ATCC 29799]
MVTSWVYIRILFYHGGGWGATKNLPAKQQRPRQILPRPLLF